MKFIRRRRALALTDYRKRLKLLKSGLPRLVVRKSNRSIIAQLVYYAKDGDIVKLSAISKELEKYGWIPKANLPTAYLTGMLIAKKAKAAKIEDEFILDTGLYTVHKNSFAFALAKGAIDNGLKLRANLSIDEKRVRGEHIAKLLESDKDKNKLSSYRSKLIDSKTFLKLFDDIKSKLSDKA
ncbi:MAG: 50S ribosomal protein L18 [Candidatus Micrarchaeota archaeon]|nr:MAG: 50S ribosomal protein L18 [Candidatus Micrarchaeota archaeon]